MGYYINPPDMSKEQFLAQHGRRLDPDESFDFKGDSLPVCWVDNGPFTAAGIAYDQREMDAFKHPDSRTKRWFKVSKEALKPYYDKEG